MTPRPRRWHWPGWSAVRTSSPSRALERRAARGERAAADLELTDEDDARLTEASDRFDPIRGGRGPEAGDQPLQALSSARWVSGYRHRYDAASAPPLGTGGGFVHVVVVGCGRVGSGLAEAVEAAGHTVAIIDRREQAFRRLSPGSRARRSSASASTATASKRPGSRTRSPSPRSPTATTRTS